MRDRDLTRRTYMAFRIGSRLQSQDVSRLLASRGHQISASRLRELGRESDRGHPITPAELYDLVSAWADEQHQAREDAE